LVYRADLQQIQVQLADQHARGRNISNYRTMLTKTLPQPTFGRYQFYLQYRLPCGKLGTSVNLSFDYTK
jgi:hypothetical protein